MSETKRFKTAQDAAWAALNSILCESIEKRIEYGGVIYRSQGTYAATAPRTQGYGNTVDVGLREENKGCPKHTTPVAFFHTHPNVSVGGLTMEYNKFKDDDVDVAKDYQIDGYLGTVDGSFFWYSLKMEKPIRLSRRLKNSK